MNIKVKFCKMIINFLSEKQLEIIIDKIKNNINEEFKNDQEELKYVNTILDYSNLNKKQKKSLLKDYILTYLYNTYKN